MKMTEAIKDFATTARTVHIRISDQVGRSILAGKVAPGDTLPTEVELCEMFGVSRTAIREAIRVLVAKGLVESRPKSGTRVRPRHHWNYFDSEVLRWQLDIVEVDPYLRKIFQLRRTIEPAAAALAADNATADDHRILEECVARMADSIAPEDSEDWLAADLDFHKSIYLATHNELFWPIGQLFYVSLQESFRISGRQRARNGSLEKHRAILDAIVRGAAEDARAAAMDLVQDAAHDIQTVLGRDVFGGDF